MTLDEYIIYEKEQLDKFQRWWLEHQEKEPDLFPDTMFDEHEWFEEYYAFSGIESP